MKKEKNDADYYINELGVLDWLNNEHQQKIRFTDRTVYKENNQLHRENGPAIEYHSGVGNQYYINGKRLELEEWKNYNRQNLINKILK